MKTIIIGTSSTVGRAVTEILSRKHEAIRAGRTQGGYQVSIASQESVEALFEKVGRIDAVASAIGNLFFGPLSIMTDQDSNQGLQDKLLDQIRLALTGQHFLNTGGSVTLISGTIAHEPIAQGTNAATISVELEEFVRTATCELGCGQRASLISSTVPSESAGAYGSFFPGSESVPATIIIDAYCHSVKDIQTRRIYKIGY